jgi:glycerol-3-phosphate dehydrogenase
VSIELEGKNKPEEITADLIVNAAGPWVDDVLRTVFGMNNVDNVRLVRGSHIVIKKKFQHDKCYIFQNADDRIVFAIPYEDEYTLIGTTDAEHGPDEGKPKISPEETAYLCKLASDYFKEPVLESDIVWTYSGVRPLYNDGASAAQEATRDYVLVKDESQPLINIFGGKITTYRKLAESMMVEIASIIKEQGVPWTKETRLPGGDCAVNAVEQETAKLKEKYPFLETEHASRLFRTYGTRAGKVLGDASDIGDLGTCLGGDLYQREVEYLKQHEWARSAEDVLFRRTKLGIEFSKKQTAKLSKYFG